MSIVIRLAFCASIPVAVFLFSLGFVAPQTLWAVGVWALVSFATGWLLTAPRTNLPTTGTIALKNYYALIIAALLAGCGDKEQEAQQMQDYSPQVSSNGPMVAQSGLEVNALISGGLVGVD